jgi:hypothetical protein
MPRSYCSEFYKIGSCREVNLWCICMWKAAEKLPPPALRDDSELDKLKAQLATALDEVAVLKVRLFSPAVDDFLCVSNGSRLYPSRCAALEYHTCGYTWLIAAVTLSQRDGGWYYSTCCRRSKIPSHMLPSIFCCLPTWQMS